MASKKTESEKVACMPEADLTESELRQLPRVGVVVENAPGRRMVSIRLRDELLQRLKQSARKKGIPYQVLIQLWLQERLDVEDAEQPEEPVAKLRNIATELQRVVRGLEVGNQTQPQGRGTRKTRS